MKSRLFFTFVAMFLLGASPGNGRAQQVPDTAFRFSNPDPSYPAGTGPVVLIDRAHHNFHTKDGGFFAFARLLEQDGYRVQNLSLPVTGPNVLDNCRILVIANALHASNVQHWVLPTPSAFTAGEIEAIRQWVKAGGRLLLIADHMPFAGAASDLGMAFGFEFLNGFAFTAERSWPPSRFTIADHTLAPSPVTTAVKENRKVDQVATFTGSALKAPTGATPVLQFLPEHWSLQPDTAWRFSARTPKIMLGGYCQGALLEYGKGRVAVFGEAAMFTAQIVNGQTPVGFNSPDAPQNARFILNLIGWMDANISQSSNSKK
jgi:hypothetical protein